MTINSMTCVCGAYFEGDGYTLVYHCPHTEQDAHVAPDSNPTYCDYEDTKVNTEITTNKTFKHVARQLVDAIAKALETLGRQSDMASIQCHAMDIDKLYVDYCQEKLSTYDPNALELVAALESNVTGQNTPRHLHGRSQRVVALEAYFDKHPVTDEGLAGLRNLLQYDKAYFDKLLASLLPLFEQRSFDSAS
ncbi:hypothetical protein [Vibrio sp. TBV020]|uniref:hypothetical protein n=1 Tax=Vibrio sp. TBV020 TaxID=3137398 RepID=UPI0038CD7172